MGNETIEWYNSMILTGMTDKFGQPWWYDAELQAVRPTTYAGPVPVDAVRSELFNWVPIEGTSTIEWIDTEGERHTQVDDAVKPLIHPQTGVVLGRPGPDYPVHGYGEWLIETVAPIVGGELSIGSAGLLDEGRVAWCQYELPEPIQVAGDTVRPWLLASTGTNGRATTLRKGATRVVCDNTLSAALAESGSVVKISHTKNSPHRIGEFRTALELLTVTSRVLARHIEILADTKVPDAVWEDFLRHHIAIPKESEIPEGVLPTVPAFKRALNSRDAMRRMYSSDPRVAPYHGTAWGVLQAANTYRWWETTIHAGTIRGERDKLAVIDGRHDRLDSGTLTTLSAAMAAKKLKRISLPTAADLQLAA